VVDTDKARSEGKKEYFYELIFELAVFYSIVGR